jgi:excisionase family DNA binding protein
MQVQLLSKKEVAQRLGMSERYVHALIKSGALKPVRMDRAVRIDINDLAALIESRKQTAPTVGLPD